MDLYARKYLNYDFSIKEVPVEAESFKDFINVIKYTKDKVSLDKLVYLCNKYYYPIECLFEYFEVDIEVNTKHVSSETCLYDKALENSFCRLLNHNHSIHFGVYQKGKEWTINIEQCAKYFIKVSHIYRFDDSKIRIYNSATGLYELFNEELFGILFSMIIDSFKKGNQIWTSRRESEVYKYIVRLVPFIPKEIHETQITLIPVNNGIVNLNNMTLIPFSYEYIFTSKSPIDFKADSDYTNFKCAMLDTCCGDEELLTLLQEWFGVGFIRNSLPAKALFLVGDGASGKSTVADLISQLYMNVSNLTLTDISHRFEVINVIDSEINIGHENSGSTKDFDPNTFKLLVTGDRMSVSVKHKTAIQTRVNTKLIFLFNSILEIGSVDSSQGFWRRVIVIELKNSFIKSSKEKKNLAKELIEKEGSGILLFALLGAKRLIENNYIFSESEASRLALDDYKKSQNPFRTFLDELVEYDDDKSLTRKDIKDRFIRYCNDKCVSTNGFDRSQIMWKEFRSWYKDTFGKEPSEYKLRNAYGFRNVAWKGRLK